MYFSISQRSKVSPGLGFVFSTNLWAELAFLLAADWLCVQHNNVWQNEG